MQVLNTMTNTSLPSETNYQRIVLKSAILSRLLILTLVLIWRSLLSPYDTSAPLNPSCLINPSSLTDYQPVRLPVIGFTIESSIVWDGVYFVRIAQCGYEYEQTYAFLPLLPLCIFLLSRTVFAPLIPFIGQRAVLGLSGYAINNIAFVYAALYFYRLSFMILKDHEAALRASILFCFNPASIFYSSIYSESLYSLFSFGGLCHFISDRNNISALWFALSGCARSNGVLNAGYICFQTMHQAYDALFLNKHVYLALQVVITGALRCICIFIPFIAFQAYGYYNICVGHFPDEMRPWCKGRVPLLYNFIQTHYWGVGFLRYFQFKQIPNFLLASPILSLAFFSFVHYAKSKPRTLFSAGLKASIEDKNSAAVLYLMGTRFPKTSSLVIQENQSLRQRKKSIKQLPAVRPVEYEFSTKPRYSSAFVLPFVLHMGFMAATAFLVMHVQVSTRFLSASPPLYWFASYLMVSPGNPKRWGGYMIWVYSAAYILLGSLLFSNFYPFT